MNHFMTNSAAHAREVTPLLDTGRADRIGALGYPPSAFSFEEFLEGLARAGGISLRKLREASQ